MMVAREEGLRNGKGTGRTHLKQSEREPTARGVGRAVEGRLECGGRVLSKRGWRGGIG